MNESLMSLFTILSLKCFNDFCLQYIYKLNNNYLYLFSNIVFTYVSHLKCFTNISFTLHYLCENSY